MLQVVRLVLLLPLGQSPEVTRRGLSSWPDCGSSHKHQSVFAAHLSRRKLTIQSQGQDVKCQPERDSPFDSGSSTGDLVTPRSVCVTSTSSVKSGESDGSGDGDGDDKELHNGASTQVGSIGVVLLQGELDGEGRSDDCVVVIKRCGGLRFQAIGRWRRWRHQG
jgi:hypothetical protein